jgi:glycosyltransferase involved in cell wall biosynthesis
MTKQIGIQHMAGLAPMECYEAAPPRRRIVFVSNTDVFFLQYRLPVATAERERGAEVVVVAPDSGCGHEIERAGFRFVALPLSRRGMNPWGELRTVAFLARLYRQLEPDLVHHLTIKPVLYGSLAARFCRRKPAVVNAVTGLGFVFTGTAASPLLRPFVRTLYRQTLRRPRTRTIFENRDDMQEFIEAGMVTEPLSTLLPGLGVDCERFRATPEPEGTPIVILPCRMLWDKGVGEFVRAAEVLRERGLGVRFVLVGSPDPGNPSCIPETQLHAWEAAGVVEWWRHRDDMPSVFAQSHVVAFPTCYREGIPRVLLEAAASARAIVATDMPGCREIVRPDLNGLLIAPRDPLALANAVQSLLESRELRHRFGAEGRAIAEREFSKVVVVDQLLQLHRQLLVRSGELTLVSDGDARVQVAPGNR